MPTYPVIHKESKQKKELSMTMKDYDQWRKDNPEWDRDWSQGCASQGEVGDWRDKMNKSHPGWGDIMRNKVYKVPGAVNDGYKF